MIRKHRKRLTTTILRGLLIFSGVIEVILIAVAHLDAIPAFTEELWEIVIQVTITIVVLTVLCCLNKKLEDQAWIQPMVSWILIVHLVILLALGDTPEEIVAGHTLFIFTLPIFLGGFLLPPLHAFLAWGVCSITITIVALRAFGHIPLVPIAELATMAILAWVLGRSITRSLQRKAELEQAKIAMLQVSAHELRTPLHALSNYIYLLKEEHSSPILERIEAHTDRLSRLVNQMVMAMKISTGEYSPTAEEISIGQLLADIPTASFPRERIQLNVATESQVTTDKQAASTILFHLIDNAIRWTDNTVRVCLFSEDGHWTIRVADQGPGLPEDRLELFTSPRHPFTTSRPGQGSGLGLYLIHGLVEAMKGNIDIKTSEGGTTIKVNLPY
jgi:signal transduction histidine kinase